MEKNGLLSDRQGPFKIPEDAEVFCCKGLPHSRNHGHHLLSSECVEDKAGRLRCPLHGCNIRTIVRSNKSRKKRKVFRY